MSYVVYGLTRKKNNYVNYYINTVLNGAKLPKSCQIDPLIISRTNSMHKKEESAVKYNTPFNHSNPLDY